MKSQQLGVRTLDEGALDQKSGMNFAEYVAILSGNTDLLDKAKLDKQITQLQKERVLFFRDIDKSKFDLKKLSEKKEAAESAVQDMKSDYDNFCKSNGVLISQDGTRLRGKDAGKYLSAWRSASMEDGATEYIGTYKETRYTSKACKETSISALSVQVVVSIKRRQPYPWRTNGVRNGWMNLGTAYLDAPQKWKQIYLASVMTSMNWKQN